MMDYQTNIPLLTTKLFIPSVKTQLVARPKLIQKLNDAAEHRLILVTAPAGYGKTTLLAAWVAQQDHPVAWVSLDQSENDPLSFIAYVVGALQNVDAGMCQTANGLIQSSEPPAIEIILTYLLNDLACLETRSLLVLDDYHVIQTPEIHTAMAFLIENAPDNLQIMIASRHLPDLPLSKLRARGQLTDLSVFDLRFNYAESVSFVNDVMGLDLQQDFIQVLENRTEGWVTGLQLAALILRGQSDVANFVNELAGDNRLIASFLIDEVLNQQSESVQRFLVQTSILKRFNASLCNALLEINDAQDLLHQLEKANLFLIPLDNRGEWYRYHHLFSEMLQRHLEQQNSDLIPTLLYRAMKWHIEQDLVEEAIDYAIEGQHFEDAANLISSNALQFQGSSKRSRLINWIERLPSSLVNAQRLWVHHAIAQFYYSRFNQARDFIETTVSDAAISLIKDEPERVLARNYRVILLATIELHTTMNAPKVRQSLQNLVKSLPEQELLSYGIGWGHLGSASLMMGYVADAQEALDKAVSTIQKKAHSIRQVFAAYQAESIACTGALHEAARAYQREYQAAYSNNTQEGDTFSNILFGLGNLYYEWNDLRRADKLISHSANIVSKGKSIDRMQYCYRSLLQLRTAQGNFTDIRQHLDYAEQVAAEYQNPPFVVDRINALKARLALINDDKMAVSRWRHTFERGKQTTDITPLQDFEWLTVAQSYLAERRYDEALTVIRVLHDYAMRQGRVRHVVELDAFMARVYAEAGEQERALEIVHRTLKLAVLEGYVRTFVDQGPMMKNCLEKLTRNEAQLQPDIAEYIRVLLLEFAAETSHPTVDAISAAASPSDLALTPRELDALNLLAEGLTYTEIAEQLVISENTLKFHLKNVYSKLDVRNRTEAVLKAQQMNIV